MGKNVTWLLVSSLSVLETAGLLQFSHTIISSCYGGWSENENISSECQFSV